MYLSLFFYIFTSTFFLPHPSFSSLLANISIFILLYLYQHLLSSPPVLLLPKSKFSIFILICLYQNILSSSPSFSSLSIFILVCLYKHLISSLPFITFFSVPSKFMFIFFLLYLVQRLSIYLYSHMPLLAPFPSLPSSSLLNVSSFYMIFLQKHLLSF